MHQNRPCLLSKSVFQVGVCIVWSACYSRREMVVLESIHQTVYLCHLWQLPQ